MYFWQNKNFSKLASGKFVFFLAEKIRIKQKINVVAKIKCIF